MLQEFFLEQADGLVRKITGYKVSDFLEDVNDFQPKEVSQDGLPAKVDLRTYMTRVEDQTEANSCTANAVAGAYEYLVKRHQKKDYDVSRLFIYYNARKFDLKIDDEEEITDEGSRISSAIKSLKKYGACSEKTWPYDLDYVNDEPSDNAYQEASEFLVEDVMFIEKDLNIWKSCLAEGHPIIFILELFKSFDKHKKKGYVPNPTKKDKQKDREEHGAHVMLCVGYSDAEQVFIVRNSWGTKWGDKGYCYIPYRYVMSKHNLDDNWVIKQLEDLGVNQESWSDGPLFDENYTSLFDSLSEEEFADMVDDMEDHPIEYRLALLMLKAADADGLDEEELDAISEYMQTTLTAMNSNLSAKSILKNCRKSLDDNDLVKQSIKLFKKHLDKKTLAKIISDIEAVISVDKFSKKEKKFVNKLMSKWQLEKTDDENEQKQADEIDLKVPKILQEILDLGESMNEDIEATYHIDEDWQIQFFKHEMLDCFVEKVHEDGEWVSYLGVEWNDISEDDLFDEEEDYVKKLQTDLGKFKLEESDFCIEYEDVDNEEGEMEYADYYNKEKDLYLRFFYWDDTNDIESYLYAKLD